MMVAVALFMVVMVVALGALLTLSQSDLKAEVLKSAINNLNFSLDSMSRAIRTGTNYHCGGTFGTVTTIPQDCINGSNYLSFTTSGGIVVAYSFVPSGQCPAGYIGGCIERQVPSISLTPSPLTSPDVNVANSSMFYVIGSCSASGTGGCAPDTIQPRVIMLIHGSVPVSSTQTSSFNLQASVTQRIYDQ